MNETEKFQTEVTQNIEGLASDSDLARHSREWIEKTTPHRYSYNFRWMGRPIIQFPQDMVAMQEILWEVKPDVVIETGVAHGGSAVFYASILQLIGGDGFVIGIDIEIRPHNRKAIEEHPLSSRIKLVEGSSTDKTTLEKVHELIGKGKKVVVALDSNHTCEHVLDELHLYSPFVGKGSYLVVFDTVIEDMPPQFFSNRPWQKGNSPKTAVHRFLAKNGRFEIDHGLDAKLQLSVAPEGYLRCVRDEER